MDYYENENLRHLSYLECLFMLPRRGLGMLPSLSSFLRQAVRLDIRGIVQAFLLPTQYADMQKASQGILNGQALFFTFGVLVTFVTAIFSGLAVMSGWRIWAGINMVLSSVIGIAFSWVISALVAWIYSIFYDRWLSIVLKILLALQIIGVIISIGNLISDILAAIAVAALIGFNLFWLLGILTGFVGSIVSIIAFLYYIKCMSLAEELFF